jgi:hypothetical protein
MIGISVLWDIRPWHFQNEPTYEYMYILSGSSTSEVWTLSKSTIVFRLEMCLEKSVSRSQDDCAFYDFLRDMDLNKVVMSYPTDLC